MYLNDASQPPPMSAAPTITNPWERRAETGVVRALWDTLVMSLSRPGDLFRGTPRSGGLGAPLAYAIILGTFGIAMSLIWQALHFSLPALFSFLFHPDSTPVVTGARMLSFVIAGLVLILSPLFALVTLFVSAGLTHLGLMVMGGDRHGFEGTFRGIAYAQGPTVFHVIPILGGGIAGIWGVVLQVIGVSKIQETEWWRALIAVLLFPCACALTGIIAAIAIAALVTAKAGA